MAQNLSFHFKSNLFNQFLARFFILPGTKTCEEHMELIASKQMLSDKFGGNFDHKKLTNNRKLMLLAFDLKILQFFQDKKSIDILIDNLTNFLILFIIVLRFFLMQLLHEIYAIWEIFHFYAI